jgi:hydroxyacylglutathione hydrolase
MPLPKIYPLKIGYSNSVVIKNGNWSVLVDTGVHGFMHSFTRYFKQIGVRFSDIKLIILTHVHYDHTGNLKDLHKLTGAKVAVHREEFMNLKNGFIQIPEGLTPNTRAISRIGRLLFPRFTSPPQFNADIVVDGSFDLGHDFGIEGRIFHTPGHTKGSQSVLLGKSLIAGDTFLNIQSGQVFPHFVDDPLQLLKTWEELFKLSIDEIYPGHGIRFTIDKAHAEHSKWKQILTKK